MGVMPWRTGDCPRLVIRLSLGVLRVSSMRLFGLAVAVFLSAGCLYEDPVFKVEVCGDVRVPLDVDAFRITIFDAQLDKELVSGTRELVSCPGVVTKGLPQSVELAAVSGESWVRVQGLKDGVTVSRFDRRVRVGEDEGADVRVSITRACLGIMCAKGQTCIKGDCVLADFSSPPEICTGPTPSGPDPTDSVVYCPDDSSNVEEL